MKQDQFVGVTFEMWLLRYQCAHKDKQKNTEFLEKLTSAIPTTKLWLSMGFIGKLCKQHDSSEN